MNNLKFIKSFLKKLYNLNGMCSGRNDPLLFTLKPSNDEFFLSFLSFFHPCLLDHLPPSGVRQLVTLFYPFVSKFDTLCIFSTSTAPKRAQKHIEDHPAAIQRPRALGRRQPAADESRQIFVPSANSNVASALVIFAGGNGLLRLRKYWDSSFCTVSMQPTSG
jgi:hypothetical protein